MVASAFLTCRPPTSCWTTWLISCSGASHLLIHALTASADILLLSLHLAIHRYAAYGYASYMGIVASACVRWGTASQGAVKATAVSDYKYKECDLGRGKVNQVAVILTHTTMWNLEGHVMVTGRCQAGTKLAACYSCYKWCAVIPNPY